MASRALVATTELTESRMTEWILSNSSLSRDEAALMAHRLSGIVGVAAYYSVCLPGESRKPDAYIGFDIKTADLCRQMESWMRVIHRG